MIFKQVTFDSQEYHKTLQLREAILRIPLGLNLTCTDTLDEDQQLHFGLFKDSDIVACVVARPLAAGRTVKLRQMAVSEAFQGQSVGRQLMSATERILKELGYSIIELHARQTAIGFYEKLGYREIGGDFMEQGITHRKMQKTI